MIPAQASFTFGDRTVTVDVGELILPALVLVVSTLYYADTRGLPDRSLMYAEPVLYIAVGLAVVTIVEHAITLGDADEPMGNGSGDRASAADLLAWTQPSSADSGAPYFSRASAAALIALTLAYVAVIALLPGFVTDVTFVGLSAGYLGALLYLFGEREWTRIVAYSVGFSVLVWAVFVRWLRVPLV